MKKIKGFTLIEAMLALSVTGVAATGAMKVVKDNNEIDKANSFSNDVKSIVNAVDKRFYTDGYNSSKWTNLEWNTTEDVVDKLLREELVATGSECTTSTWTPSNINDQTMQSISCDLFEKIPYDLDITAKNKTDGNNYINKFEILFSFKSEESFRNDFKSISMALNKLKSTNEGLSGTHLFNFTDVSGDYISRSECLKLGEDCKLKASFNREGGREYLSALGDNSMIGSKLNFVASESETAILKCVRWKKELDGSWGATPTSVNSDCGIGLYQDDPIMIEVVASEGTFNRILLDKKCAVLDLNSDDKVIRTTTEQPCGMVNDGEAYQVLDSSQARNAYFEKVYSNDLKSRGLADFNKIIVKKIAAENIETKAFKATLLSTLNELKVEGTAVFEDVVTFKEDVIFKKNIEITGNVKAATGEIAEYDDKFEVIDDNFELLSDVMAQETAARIEAERQELLRIEAELAIQRAANICNAKPDERHVYTVSCGQGDHRSSTTNRNFYYDRNSNTCKYTSSRVSSSGCT